MKYIIRNIVCQYRFLLIQILFSCFWQTLLTIMDVSRNINECCSIQLNTAESLGVLGGEENV